MLDAKTMKAGDRFWRARKALLGTHVEVEAVYVREVFPGVGPRAWGTGGWECSIPMNCYTDPERRWQLPELYATPHEAYIEFIKRAEKSLVDLDAAQVRALAEKKLELATMKRQDVKVRDRGPDYEAPDY